MEIAIENPKVFIAVVVVAVAAAPIRPRDGQELGCVVPHYLNTQNRLKFPLTANVILIYCSYDQRWRP